MIGELAFHAPPGWVPARVPPASPSPASPVTLDVWRAWMPADASSARAVLACYGRPLDTWTDEATPLALDQIAATAGGIASALEASPVAFRSVDSGAGVPREQSLARVGDRSGTVVAKTAFGFGASGDGPRAEGCLIVCAPSVPACEAALTTASPSGFVTAPAPTLSLRTLAYGVHHPRGVAAFSFSLCILAGVVAVWLRPKSDRK